MRWLLLVMAVAACRSSDAPPGYHVKDVKQVGGEKVVEIERNEPRDPKKLSAACDAGSGPACREYALSLVGSDNAKAEETWYRLCEKDDWVACSELAYQYNNPFVKLPHQAERALTVSTKACEHHAEPISCATLSNAYKKGVWGAMRDEKRARELVVQACKDGHYWSCKEAGLPPPR